MRLVPPGRSKGLPGVFLGANRGKVIRVSFLVDGFNVYHSIDECLTNGRITHGKWFDYRGYCQWVVDHNPEFRGDWQIHKVRM